VFKHALYNHGVEALNDGALCVKRRYLAASRQDKDDLSDKVVTPPPSCTGARTAAGCLCLIAMPRPFPIQGGAGLFSKTAQIAPVAPCESAGQNGCAGSLFRRLGEPFVVVARQRHSEPGRLVVPS